MTDIEYIGEATYAETIQQPMDSFKEGFPQRRQHVLKGIQERGNRVFVTLVENTGKVKIVNRAPKGLKTIKIADNPIVALNVQPKVDIFEHIDWYSEMRAAEFGKDKLYYLLRYAEQQVVEEATHIIAQGKYNAEFCRQFNDNVSIIPNGVDTSHFYPRNVDKPDVFTLIFVGKLNKWYSNIFHICEAVEEFGGKAKLGVVGDGTLMPDLLAKKYEHTKFLGHQPYDEIPELMSEADAAVFTTDDDSPCVIPEYMACGLPIVTVKGRIDWIVQDEVNGMLVEPNMDGFYWAIDEMMSNPEKVETIGKVNRRKAKEELSWDILLNKYDSIVKEVAK